MKRLSYFLFLSGLIASAHKLIGNEARLHKLLV
jgi:hypothetical protein